MSCQRAQQVDLAAFLAEPRDAAFGDFREHYPACPACSAAVADGTRLERALRAMGDASGDHPDPDLLACWHADRTVLDADARERLSQHLERCSPCREELRALRAFDPAALRAPAAPERPQPAAPDPVPWWRYLLGSPASAMAMAGVVLAPFVYLAIDLGDRLRSFNTDTPLERSLALEEPPQRGFADETPEALVNLAESAVPRPSRTTVERRTLGKVVAGRLPASQAPADALALSTIAASPAESVRKSGDVVERSTTSPLRARSSTSASVFARSSTRAFALGSETLQIDAADVSRGIELSVPVPERWRDSPELSLHFSDGRGRERRELLRHEIGAPIVSVVLEPGWLLPGAWQVSLVPPHGDPERFAIEVR